MIKRNHHNIHSINLLWNFADFPSTDILLAQAKYDHHLKQGIDLKLNGKEDILALECMIVVYYYFHHLQPIPVFANE